MHTHRHQVAGEALWSLRGKGYGCSSSLIASQSVGCTGSHGDQQVSIITSHLVDLRNCVIHDPPVQSVVIDPPLLHLVPKTGLFLEEASSSVVPSLAHCTYCIIICLIAEFQTLLKIVAGFLIISMRISHRSCCRRKLLSRGILLLYAAFRESFLRGIKK